MFGVPLHKLMVHFPIALAVVALAYDFWASYARNPKLHSTGFSLSLLAAVTAAGATVTGLQASGVTRLDGGLLTGHAGFGITATIVAVGFALWRYSAMARREKPDERYSGVWLFIQLLAVILILLAAITGHRL